MRSEVAHLRSDSWGQTQPTSAVLQTATKLGYEPPYKYFVAATIGRLYQNKGGMHCF